MRPICSSWCFRSCRSGCCAAAAWPAAGHDRPVGRLHADAGDRAGRHRAVAADRHRAGARPAVQAADHPYAVRHLHRVRARRAADHRPLHGQRDAAAVPAAGHGRQRAAARAGRHHGVRLGLHGGGGARRLAGDPERAVRGRHGARARLLADDAPDRAAAGVAHRDPLHRQHLHRVLQGHDPGLDRRTLRFPEHGARRLQGPATGSASRSPAMRSAPSSTGCAVSRCRATACTWSASCTPATRRDSGGDIAS